MMQRRMTAAQADLLSCHLLSLDWITKVKVSERTADAVILYKEERDGRERLLTALSEFGYDRTEVQAPEHTGRELSRTYEEKLFFMVAGRLIRILLFPDPVRRVLCVGRAVRFVRDGLRCLRQGRLEVPVLDATTIAVSLIRGDFRTAGSVMFLLQAGGLLEEWTHKKSVDDLARRMYLNIDKAWIRTDQGEVLVSVRDVQPGDCVIVRTQFLPNKHANAIVNIDTGKLNGDSLHDKMSFWKN